ncbi:MAG: phosphate ABC transporter substrate-binding protein [Candidatus Eremiobacteraeota bacterium]|nr:phosphate ABC transporter substrate-binding protein [Candidatus Eremiobacteraeota bacterium]
MFQKLLITMTAAALLTSLTACGGGSSSSSSSTADRSQGASESGAITIDGSTALLPLVKQAAVDYQTAHPNVKISVSGGGSVVGITQAAQKAVDIGDSDIPAPKNPELLDHQVAVVTFAVIANPAVGVKNLTKAQIGSLFSGTVTNWKQLGGKDQPITIINRPRSSGTRAVFVQKLMGGQQPTASGLTQDSSGTVVTTVAQTPGAVSYVATGYLKKGGIIALSIDGVAPLETNVISGKYPFWSYEHMFTLGSARADVAKFIDYVKTDKSVLNQLGFTAVGEMKAK